MSLGGRPVHLKLLEVTVLLAHVARASKEIVFGAGYPFHSDLFMHAETPHQSTPSRWAHIFSTHLAKSTLLASSERMYPFTAMRLVPLKAPIAKLAVSDMCHVLQGLLDLVMLFSALVASHIKPLQSIVSRLRGLSNALLRMLEHKHCDVAGARYAVREVLGQRLADPCRDNADELKVIGEPLCNTRKAIRIQRRHCPRHMPHIRRSDPGFATIFCSLALGCAHVQRVMATFRNTTELNWTRKQTTMGLYGGFTHHPAAAQRTQLFQT